MAWFVCPSDGLENAEKLRKKRDAMIKQYNKEIQMQERMYYRAMKEFAEKKLEDGD